jgi:hypothetical protein
MRLALPLDDELGDALDELGDALDEGAPLDSPEPEEEDEEV